MKYLVSKSPSLMLFIIGMSLFLLVGCSSESSSSSKDDPDGSSASEAISLTKDSAYSSTIAGSETSQYFTFVASATGDYLFSLDNIAASSTDLDILIYSDSDFSTGIVTNETPKTGDTFIGAQLTESGTYYIEVKNYSTDSATFDIKPTIVEFADYLSHSSTQALSDGYYRTFSLNTNSAGTYKFTVDNINPSTADVDVRIATDSEGTEYLLKDLTTSQGDIYAIVPNLSANTTYYFHIVNNSGVEITSFTSRFKQPK